jgi:hypothetical protein
MPQIIKSYEWQIEGTVDTSVWMRLGLDCKVKGTALLSVDLGAVFCDGVTFGYRRTHEVICDGEPQLNGTVNPELPKDVIDFYVAAFKDEYSRCEWMRDEIFESVVDEAINAHFEMLAVA